MSTPASPYAGARIALATLHGKADALAPAFAALGARLVLAEGVDTDLLGTFSGEIARTQPPLETAIAKARLAMAATGLPLGLATEGSFGSDPVVGLLPLHRETIVLVDDARGMVVHERIDTHETNHGGGWLCDGEGLDVARLSRWGFPSHAVMVRSEPFRPGMRVVKGIVERDALERAVAACIAASPEGRARVDTDMRAHLNPTRMRQIALLGERLAQRLRCLCPQCDAPGFGMARALPGLPCEGCGMPTTRLLAEVHACPACGHSTQRPRSDGLACADPAHCDICNP